MDTSKLQKRNLAILQWFGFFHDFRPYAVISIIYFSQVTGSFTLGLSIFSIALIASSIFEIPTGIFSDYLGRKRTMIFGALASIFALIFYALGGSFLILAIGSIFLGLSEAFFSGNNDALLYESLENPEDHYAEINGKMSSLSQIGLAISALLGGFLAFKSLSLVLWVSVIPQVILLFLAFAIAEPKIHRRIIDENIFSHIRESFVIFIKNKKLRALTLTSASQLGIEETLFQFAPAFIALLWPTWALGIIRSVNSFIAATSFWYAGKVIKRWTAIRAFVFGNLSNRFFAIAATSIPTPFSPILLSCSDIFYGVITVAQSTLLQKEFTDHQRATMGSLNSLLGSLFFAIFAFFFGHIADSIGPAHSLLLGNLLLLFVIFFYWTFFKKEKAPAFVRVL